MTKPLKIGFLGVGAWARATARAIKSLPEVQIVTCHSRDPHHASEFAAENQCPATDNEEDFFSFPGMEAVAVLTPNDLHCEQVRLAAQHGLHVIVEKPMANSLEEAATMIDVTRRAGVVLAVGHNTRRESRFRRIKQLLQQGDLGKAVLANVIFTSEAGLGKRLGGWRYDANRCPALALAQIGIHAVDLLNYMFGVPKTVEARLGQIGLGEGMDDACTAMFEYESGLVATFNNAYSVPRVRTLHVMGTGGNALSQREGEIYLQGLGQVEGQREELAEVNTVAEEYAEFAACCREGRAPETDGLAGWQSISVMQAMLRSDRERRPVEVEQVPELIGA